MKRTWLITTSFVGAALFGAAACTSNSTEISGTETAVPSVPADTSSPVASSGGSAMEASVPGSASSDDAGNVEGGAQDSSFADALSSATPDAEATSTTTAPDGTTAADCYYGSWPAPLGLEEVGSPCRAPHTDLFYCVEPGMVMICLECTWVAGPPESFVFGADSCVPLPDCEGSDCRNSFTCGEATCGAPTSEYCSVVVSRQGVASLCAPLPTGCTEDVSCECVTGEPPGLDCSIGTSGEVIVTLEAS
jgi:hypothetical protein